MGVDLRGFLEYWFGRERGFMLITAVLEAALRVFFDFREGGMF